LAFPTSSTQETLDNRCIFFFGHTGGGSISVGRGQGSCWNSIMHSTALHDKELCFPKCQQGHIEKPWHRHISVPLYLKYMQCATGPLAHNLVHAEKEQFSINPFFHVHCQTKMCIFYIYTCVFFCIPRDGTQGLMHAWKVLYLLL
jgi:hypothetical protein